jgi:hypothetical protein
MNRFVRRRFRFLFLIVAVFSISARAEEPKATGNKTETAGELFETIAHMDSTIFDAFNAHDVDRLMSLFTDDLEFYHDTGGLGDYRQNAEDFKKMFASTPDIRRELVKGSLEVYPIKDYGAIRDWPAPLLPQGKREGRLWHFRIRDGLAEDGGVVEDFPCP